MANSPIQNPKSKIQNRENWTRYTPGQAEGHYESFFQRANHPTRPLAFWLRYTLFSPQGRPDDTVGELWAIYFDGESGRHVALQQEWPLNQCHFARDGFAVQVGAAELSPGRLQGSLTRDEQNVTWRLTFTGDQSPLFLLPLRLYEGGFPKAKSLVGLPLAIYEGTLTANGQTIPVDGWVGSQNHNWGSRHTDRYAWGQVAGFDNAPDTFLEVATAQIRLGRFWTPPLTPLVLRHQGQEYALNSLWQSGRNKGRFQPFEWQFRAETATVRIEGEITAPAAAFVELRYRNPPGGLKQCLNSKIASCRLTLTHKADGRTETLITTHRAAFEILSDDTFQVTT
ncbi:MAG: hypothetical protein AB1791_00635 [Chloroflexota bacterium]